MTDYLIDVIPIAMDSVEVEEKVSKQKSSDGAPYRQGQSGNIYQRCPPVFGKISETNLDII